MSVARAAIGASFITTGVLHFVRPRMYQAMIPRCLPAHHELVLASGVAELAGGAGVLHPRTRRAAGWWLIATLVAVFPANVEMAVHAERFKRIPKSLLYARLPLQGAMIALVWKITTR